MKFNSERCLSCGTAVKPSGAIAIPETDFWFCSHDHYSKELLELMPEHLHNVVYEISEERAYEEILESIELSHPDLRPREWNPFEWGLIKKLKEDAKQEVLNRQKWAQEREEAINNAKQQIHDLCLAEQRLADKKEEEKQQKEMEREAGKQQREQEKQQREAEKTQKRDEEEAARLAEEEQWRPRPFKLLNQEARFSSHWICGMPGTGKSNALLFMIAQDLQRGSSVITLDAKGDLTNALRNLVLGNRLIVLDPNNPFAINPLDVPKTDVKRAVNQLEYIFGSLLGATVTPKQQSFLRSILRAVVVAFPDPNLLTIQHLVNRGWKEYESHLQQLPSDLQDFFFTEWKDYDATRSELKWRIRLLMENELVLKMFSAPRTRFNIAKHVMDADGKLFVIDNSIEKLHEDGSAFLGRFFLAQIWAAATARASRPQTQKKPVYVYLDEAHKIINPLIADIIDLCRSQRIALILSHQRAAQIEDSNVRSALENCAIKMANVDAEAKYFSDLLHIPEDRINQLPRGHFAMHVRGEGSSIVEVPLAKLPGRTMDELDRTIHREKMRQLYGYETQKPPVKEAVRSGVSLPEPPSRPAAEASGVEYSNIPTKPSTGISKKPGPTEDDDDPTKPASSW